MVTLLYGTSQKLLWIESKQIGASLLLTWQQAVKLFFVHGVLPEIVGKFYARKAVSNREGMVPVPASATSTIPSSTNKDSESDGKTWCYCNEPEGGDMIYCDNDHCSIK